MLQTLTTMLLGALRYSLRRTWHTTLWTLFVGLVLAASFKLGYTDRTTFQILYGFCIGYVLRGWFDAVDEWKALQ